MLHRAHDPGRQEMYYLQGNTILIVKYKYFDDFIYLLKQSKIKWLNLGISENMSTVPNEFYNNELT
jgi:hypothetical protein